MNTSYLRTFIEVVNLRSFSKAAEKLFLTQPAITKQVKILENDFGVVLIRRSYNDIILTKEGKDLYKYAVTILNKEEEIYAKFLKNNSEVSGELTIYSSSLPGNYLLDKILSNFSDMHNSITYNLKIVDSKKVYDMVINGNTSFGFTGSKVIKNNIGYMKIAEDELVLAVSAKKYKHLTNKDITLKYLFEQDFLIREKGSATLKTFEEAIKKEKYSISDLKIKGIIEDNEIIKKMIIQGFGISIVSKLSINKEIKDGLIIPFKIKNINLTRGIYYIYHKKRYFSNTETKFKQFIEENYFK